MARKSKREVLEDEINLALLNISPGNVNEVYTRLVMHSNQFPLFHLMIDLKKKIQIQECDGYCKVSHTKHKKNELSSFPDHIHKFCQFCLEKWIGECFSKNPNNPIACQRCTNLGQAGPTFSENDICNFLNYSYEQVLQYRENYQDPQFYTSCNCCGSTIYKQQSFVFLCTHVLCELCVQNLIRQTLDYYYNMMNDPSQDISNLTFEIRCPCYNEISSQNNLMINLLQHLQSMQNSQEYIYFVQRYPNFFQGRAKLIRCLNNKCGVVAEALQISMTCLSCSSCMRCGSFSHPGMSCDEMKTIVASNKYEVVNPNNPMLPQPPEGIKQIVDLYSKLTVKIEQYFNIPRRITKVWEIKNPYLEYYFGFAKQKDYIFSELMDHATSDTIMKNNFTADAKGMITFPQKINNIPDKKFLFYLEVMFDEVENQDPDLVDSEKKKLKLLMLKCNNMFCFNSLQSIRILLMLELN